MRLRALGNGGTQRPEHERCPGCSAAPVTREARRGGVSGGQRRRRRRQWEPLASSSMDRAGEWGGSDQLEGRESRRDDLDRAEPSFRSSCAKLLSTSAKPPINTTLDGWRGSIARYIILKGVKCPNPNLGGLSVPNLIVRGVM
jgi:hypothetical protein